MERDALVAAFTGYQADLSKIDAKMVELRLQLRVAQPSNWHCRNREETSRYERRPADGGLLRRSVNGLRISTLPRPNGKSEAQAQCRGVPNALGGRAARRQEFGHSVRAR